MYYGLLKLTFLQEYNLDKLELDDLDINEPVLRAPGGIYEIISYYR
jgi:hypothetical protein